MALTHEKYKGIKNPDSWDVPGIEIPALQSFTSLHSTNSARDKFATVLPNGVILLIFGGV
jgi:hypothetical protein